MHSSFSSLHPFQADAIAALRSPKIHLALTAPTGAGKGVILERLAENPGERILLLTPLVALGRQQVLRFQARNISTYSTIGVRAEPPSSPFFLDRARVWVSSPEAAFSVKNLEQIRNWKPSLIAVDEAHCIEEWGDEFRPAYRKIIEFVRDSGIHRSLWMSATFPRSLIQRLATEVPGRWKTQGKFAIPKNLSISVQRVSFSDRLESIHRSVLKKTEAGILFTGTRKNVGRYHGLFESSGRIFLPYHAGMSDEERRNVERRLQVANEFNPSSVIATNAFGMGMDYGQLRWVILAQAPFSLLGMMQALGRVARGSEKGEAELYWAEEDFRISGYLVRAETSETKGAHDLADLRNYLEATESEKEQILGSVFL